MFSYLERKIEHRATTICNILNPTQVFVYVDQHGRLIGSLELVLYQNVLLEHWILPLLKVLNLSGRRQLHRQGTTLPRSYDSERQLRLGHPKSTY